MMMIQSWKTRVVCALALAALLPSCTVLESNRSDAPFVDSRGATKLTQITSTYSLPRRYLSIEIKGNADTMRGSTRFSVSRNSEQEYLGPDPSPLFRYVVNYVPSRLSNDTIDIDIKNQLLETVTVATDDQTGQTLINLAKSLGGLSRASRGLTLDVPGGDADAMHLIATLRLDPTDPASVSKAQRFLSHNSTHGMEMVVTPVPRPVLVVPACNHAVCYRPLTSVTLSFIDKRTGNVTEFVTSVPDPHQIAGLDIERSTFVKRDTAYTFAEGTLIKVDIDKPSELAAAALLPLNIVTAVLDGTNTAISALLGVEQGEIGAQTELLKAQTEFLNALKAYNDAEDAAGLVTLQPDGGVVGGRTEGNDSDEDGDGGEV